MFPLMRDQLVGRLALSVAASAGLLALTVAPAAAQAACYPNCPQPTLLVSLTVVLRNGVFQVTVTNFAPGTTVTFTIQSVEQTLGNVVTDQQGTGSTSLAAPADAELALHTLSAKGIDLTGGPAVLRAGITVVAPDGVGVLGSVFSADSAAAGSTGTSSTAKGSLAKTGAVVLPTTAAGLALVAGGAVLRQKAKKRKTVGI